MSSNLRDNIGNLVQGNTQNSGGIGVGSLFWTEKLQSLKQGKMGLAFYVDDQEEAAYALSIGAKINDLWWPRTAIHTLF